MAAFIGLRIDGIPAFLLPYHARAHRKKGKISSFRIYQMSGIIFFRHIFF
jgi:hypothetical protein